jgi:hypothetical protein
VLIAVDVSLADPTLVGTTLESFDGSAGAGLNNFATSETIAAGRSGFLRRLGAT